MNVQEQEEQERKQEKDQDMAAAEVRRANQLIYDQITALEPSPMPGMIGKTTSESWIQNSTTIWNIESSVWCMEV